MSTQPRHYSVHDQPFWESVSEGRMKLQHCAECGQFRYPPASCCASCLSTDAGWTEISGRARVVSWTTFHRQYLPAWPAPHTVVVAALEEGPLFISTIGTEAVPRLKLDAPLRIVYADHADGYRIAGFELSEDG